MGTSFRVHRRCLNIFLMREAAMHCRQECGNHQCIKSEYVWDLGKLWHGFGSRVKTERPHGSELLIAHKFPQGHTLDLCNILLDISVTLLCFIRDISDTLRSHPPNCYPSLRVQRFDKFVHHATFNATGDSHNTRLHLAHRNTQSPHKDSNSNHDCPLAQSDHKIIKDMQSTACKGKAAVGYNPNLHAQWQYPHPLHGFSLGLVLLEVLCQISCIGVCAFQKQKQIKTIALRTNSFIIFSVCCMLQIKYER